MKIKKYIINLDNDLYLQNMKILKTTPNPKKDDYNNSLIIYP